MHMNVVLVAPMDAIVITDMMCVVHICVLCEEHRRDVCERYPTYRLPGGRGRSDVPKFRSPRNRSMAPKLRVSGKEGL